MIGWILIIFRDLKSLAIYWGQVSRKTGLIGGRQRPHEELEVIVVDP
jgi:hypothetical protein